MTSPLQSDTAKLTGAFNASVTYQLHSNPPIFGLYSDKLGATEIHLGDLDLTEREIDDLVDAKRVVGTYETRPAVDVYHPINGIQKSTWKVTSLKPA